MGILDAPTRPKRLGLRTVFLGDSYMAITKSVTGTPGAPAGVESFGARTPITWADFWLGGRLNRVGYFGGSGEQTHQWLARYDSQVPAANPDIVFMGSAGINDMNNGKTAAQAFANLVTMFDKNAALGALTVMLGPVPFGDATSDQKAFIHTMAALLRREAQTRRNFVLIDCHPALSDMTAADTWLGLPGATYTADGTHLGPWGAMRVGRLIADALEPILPSVLAWPSGSGSTFATVDKNLLANPGLTGTAGTLGHGATGSVADSWTVNSQSGVTFTGTVVAAKVASTDRKGGDWQEITIAGTAEDAQFFQHVYSGYTVGKSYVGVMEVDTADYQPTGAGSFRLRLWDNITGGSAYAQGIDVSSVDESAGFPTDNLPGQGIGVTPPLVLGAGASRLSLGFILNGLGTIRFRRPAIMQID